MLKKSQTIILASLMLILSVTSLRADEVTKVLAQETNPAGSLCLSKDEVHMISLFKLNCDKQELNKSSLEKALDDCMKPEPQSYISPKMTLIVATVSALIIGFYAGRN